MAGEVSVTIVGNLADDPELRYTQGGVAVVSIRVGSTPRTMNRSTNEWVDGETVWVRCTAWREVAENVAQSLTKGSRVVVTGRLKAPSAYQTAQGEARASLELEIDEVGPSLRYATASVTRRAREGGAVESPWGGNQSAPQVQSGADAWANPADAATDEAPF
ncbi:MAG: single-stranded DNA-binding protein [Aquiluna sp.]|jgi:single-strand DNA-binding protein|uniref:single-stranded DNA-binding protein n=1 Tax=Aquiluna sp. TaxID=2053504 RepID=UPI0027728199|nr:single-stranded DNA-binding protein [Aquiluna sp.]MDP4887099.1 single-stranded DNA-binding protein [Aquiluna sp.]